MSPHPASIPRPGAPQGAPSADAPKAPSKPRQFINFSFYKIDPAFRRLSSWKRASAKRQALAAVEHFQSKMLLNTYTTFGYRPETDFFFWRITTRLEDYEEMNAALMRTPLGGYLATPYSYLSQGKRSTYVDKINPEHETVRGTIVPGKYKYIFVYPFLKTREWFLLPMEKRQEMMDEHIRVGNQFPTVKLNTTYSFGLDDQEWVVAFESDYPSDFLDLVMALRETQGSRYTLRDTPIFTGVKRPFSEALDLIL
jgi:chlorite dismutase